MARKASQRQLPAMSVQAPAARLGAGAVGALAVGAMAFGAVAIGAFAIGRLVVGRARFRSMEIDDLTVRRLRVIDFERGNSRHLRR